MELSRRQKRQLVRRMVHRVRHLKLVFHLSAISIKCSVYVLLDVMRTIACGISCWILGGSKKAGRSSRLKSLLGAMEMATLETHIAEGAAVPDVMDSAVTIALLMAIGETIVAMMIGDATMST